MSWVQQIGQAASAVENLSEPSTANKRTIQAAAGDALGIPATDVYPTTISKAGNVSVRLQQSKRGLDAVVVIPLLTDPTDLDATLAAARKEMERRATRQAALIYVPGRSGFELARAMVAEHGHLTEKIVGAVRPDMVETFVPSLSRSPQVVAPSYHLEIVDYDEAPVEVDARVRRMLRLALRSARAVLLVGPPGTGKSTLVKEAVAAAVANPQSYGLTGPPNVPLWATPDDRWTSLEMIGGLTVAPGGDLEFRPGVLLQALEQNRWLVLDEANRGDLDHIFGAALTWLAGQLVSVGQESTARGSAEIQLAWDDAKPASEKFGKDPIRYMAGSDWRLLGTYNSVDAQRVFHFGAALSRRFRHVPVDAPRPETVQVVLDTRLEDLDDDARNAVVDRITGVYVALYRDARTRIGPAALLDAAAYVREGLSEDPAAGIDALVAEGVLVCVGPWLAGMEADELDAFGVRVSEQGGLESDGWAWLRAQLSATS